MACFFEGEELGVGDDEVVEDLDAEDFAGVAEAFGELDVFAARRWVPGGMVVGEDDVGCAHEDCGAENLAGVNQRSIQRAD